MSSRLDPLRLAWFVSPHGFGHAARACALMSEIACRYPHVQFEIFTTVPERFFSEALPNCRYRRHPLLTDIGLVQKNAIDEDLAATSVWLARLLPYDPAALRVLADLVRALDCRLVFSDISPLGLAVAEVAGIASILIENFTWDWIYRAYVNDLSSFGTIALELERVFAKATLRVRTAPFCGDFDASLVVAPTCRKPRLSRLATRTALGLTDHDRVVLLTMGGILWDHKKLLVPEEIATGVVVIVPGGGEKIERRGAFLLLPFHSSFYHPDLVAASDAVVGKLGYSTLAEIYHAGVPFGFIPRSRFPESKPLGRFVVERMSGCLILPEELVDGGWKSRLDEVLGLPRSPRFQRNGSEQIVDFLEVENLLPG